MSLQKISHFFDKIRGQNDKQLEELRIRVRQLAKTCSLHLSRENLVVFIQDIFSGITSWFALQEDQVDQILDQLRRSLEGHAFDMDVFIACWEFWLRKDGTRKTALIVVDIQNDFITGSLALKNCPAGQDGYEVVPIINDILKQERFDLVVYTLDWHLPDHCSFIDNVSLYPLDPSSPVSAEDAKIYDTVIYSKPIVLKQKLWPSHCVQNSWGSELHKDLKPPEKSTIVVKKGDLSYVDSYSAFWSNGHYCTTELFGILLKHGITDVYVCGLALDYCVEFTSRDATQHGFNTFVVEDACCFICEKMCGDTKMEFKKAGIKLMKKTDLKSHLKQS
ncbi:uncharacterized protein LOC116307669 isoform X2 [Actinia tenebrosa]|uniref:nicotinamidase n=1 Tax=Actinia tenebrosa TaxID=6105 RepID=A0A6P8J2M1_ACTTE|nr:uncharacterized protein LOC116307669 isoform X2 [Actinia tenebrosa]